MPTMKPSSRLQPSALSDRVQTVGTEFSLEQRVEQALDVVKNLQGFSPRVFPVRPEILTYDDNQLVEADQARQHGKLGKAAAEQLRYFGAWRQAVWHIEGHHEGGLIVLATAIANLEAGERSEARTIRSFIREHWRCSLPEPVPQNRAWIERWATRFAQNRQILPLYMRTMTKPPLGQGGRKSGESGAPQQYLDYGADPDEDERDVNEPGF